MSVNPLLITAVPISQAALPSIILFAFFTQSGFSWQLLVTAFCFHLPFTAGKCGGWYKQFTSFSYYIAGLDQQTQLQLKEDIEK